MAADAGEDVTRGACGEVCRATLLAHYAGLGVDAHVTIEPPIVRSKYEPLDMICPHGRPWYAEPTGEQIAAWAAAEADRG